MDSAQNMLEAGDLIQFVRKGGRYSHYGIYDGQGHVIHVTGSGGKLYNMMAVTSMVDAFVRKHTLAEAAGLSPFYINNFLDDTYSARDANDIVKRAEARIGEKWPYKLLKWNCEHFASQMRYGTAVSLQGLAGKKVIRKVKRAVKVTGVVAVGSATTGCIIQ